MGGFGTVADQISLEGEFARLLAIRDKKIVSGAEFHDLPGTVKEYYFLVAKEFVKALDIWEEAHAPGTLENTAEEIHRLLRRRVKQLSRQNEVGDEKAINSLSKTLNEVSAALKRIQAGDLDRWASMSVEEKQDSILREVDRWTREEQQGFAKRLDAMMPKLRAV